MPKLPKPVRTAIDVGRIFSGLRGLHGLYTLAVGVGAVGVILAVFQELPVESKALISVSAVLLLTAVGGHVGAWLGSRKTPLDRLEEHRTYAVDHLLNRNVESVGDVGRLRDDQKKWIRITAADMRKARMIRHDITRFERLSTYQPKGLFGVTPEHAELRDIIAERIDRLDAAMDRKERAE